MIVELLLCVGIVACISAPDVQETLWSRLRRGIERTILRDFDDNTADRRRLERVATSPSQPKQDRTAAQLGILEGLLEGQIDRQNHRALLDAERHYCNQRGYDFDVKTDSCVEPLP